MFNNNKIGKVLINGPYPFALIKLYDPEFSEFKDKKLSFSYLNYSKEFNIQESDYKVKWLFSPLKIFQINANQ